MYDLLAKERKEEQLLTRDEDRKASYNRGVANNEIQSMGCFSESLMWMEINHKLQLNFSMSCF